MLTKEQQETVDRNERSLNIAHTICEQLGGQRRLKMFINAQNFRLVNNGVAFKHMLSNHCNYMCITLNGQDLYDISFQRIWAGKLTTVSEYTNVYADQMEQVIYNATGLCLSL